MSEKHFAGTLIIKDEKILLVQEAHKEAYKLWSLPLSHVEDEEDISETAIRETYEETGYTVSLGKEKEIKIDGDDFKSISEYNKDKITLIIFEASIIGGGLKIGDDVLNVKWFSINDINRLSLRGDWIKSFTPASFD